MKKLQHYISLNLLSMTGFAFVAFLLLTLFYIYPQAFENSLKDNPGDNFEVTYGVAMQIFDYIGRFLIVESIIILFAIAEVIFYKLKKNICIKVFMSAPDKFEKIHILLFYLGIVFALIPFCFLILTFL